MSSSGSKQSKKTNKGKSKVIPFAVNPNSRMEKPKLLKAKQEFKVSTFSKTETDSQTPFKATEKSRLIYPNTTLRQSDDPRFSGKFENGNLDTVFWRAKRAYEIHVERDTVRSSNWFLFKCDDIKPGKYTFIITGFSKNITSFHHGYQPVALSTAKKSKKRTWEKIGSDINFWLSVSGSSPEYTLSFTFQVKELDSMYFAYSYPYTFSYLLNYLSTMPERASFCTPAKTTGGLDIPFIFWDADLQRCITLTPNKASIPKGKKPLAIVVARHHPNETSASYAMEGLINFVFSDDEKAVSLRQKFSLLLIPMVNVDGVICGFTRSGVNGFDINRVWKTKGKCVEANSITAIVDELAITRRIVFFLDFHGHTNKYNVFSIGVRDRKTPMNELQGVFTRHMSKSCKYYEFLDSTSTGPRASEKTNRVGFHNRYKIPFSYTLEISNTGTTKENPPIQFNPNHFREIGTSVGVAMFGLLVSNIEVNAAFSEQVGGRRPAKAGSIFMFQGVKNSPAISVRDGRVSRAPVRRRRVLPVALSENPSDNDLE